jgi:HlyD family secretion protein
MKRALRLVLILALAAAGGGWLWYRYHNGPPTAALVLYGNVDLRQVQLAFNNSERIAAVFAQEGDRVHAGQVLATLDTSRLEPHLANAEAQVAAQAALVEKLHNGSRPEEIAQARADVESAKANATNASIQFDNTRKLLAEQAATQLEYDNVKAALDVAAARLVVTQKALELALAGPRYEDVAQAEATLRGEQAQLELMRQQLADARLVAPAEAIVRTRLLEPGEMVTPQKAVFSLALVDPKWVRAYVAEPDLGRVQPGMAATVGVDSFPGHAFEGWVGFVSPAAEFTPKIVQTEELRTSLVYEVRVFVRDPGDVLRLGMPATVRLLPGTATTPPSDSSNAVTTRPADSQP